MAEAKWVPLAQLRAHAERHPEQYTQVGGGGAQASRGGRLVWVERKAVHAATAPAGGAGASGLLACCVQAVFSRPAPASVPSQWFLDEVRSLGWFGVAAQEDNGKRHRQHAAAAEAAAPAAAGRQLAGAGL